MRNLPPVAAVAGWLALLATAAAILRLIALPILSPEFSPSGRGISQYALGRYGWVRSPMFLSWSIGSWALGVAIWSQVQTNHADANARINGGHLPQHASEVAGCRSARNGRLGRPNDRPVQLCLGSGYRRAVIHVYRKHEIRAATRQNGRSTEVKSAVSAGSA